MDTFIYVIYGILVLCGIIVFICVGNGYNFIDPNADDEIYSRRTVKQMYEDEGDQK